MVRSSVVQIFSVHTVYTDISRLSINVNILINHLLSNITVQKLSVYVYRLLVTNYVKWHTAKYVFSTSFFLFFS